MVVYDDDTSPRPFFQIRCDDAPLGDPVPLPSAEIQAIIKERGETPGWNVHRIRTELRYRGIEVSVEAVRQVLATK